MNQPSLFADFDPGPPVAVAPQPPARPIEGAPPRSGSPVLLALDGNSLLHRAYHAYERSDLTRSDGSPVFAVYGFLALLAGIADKTRPDALVVGFDSRVSVRKERWPHYKAQRSSAPDSLYSQMDEVRDILTEIGITVVSIDGWEADDVIASAATRAEALGWECVVATSDRDSFALISERTTVLRLGSGLDNATWMTPERLVADYGVRPDQYIHFAALRGDPSDNLPGARGIGAKTAAKLLAACDVEAALADPALCLATIGKAASGHLAAGAVAYRHNLEVMELRRDLDVDPSAGTLSIDGAHLAQVLNRREVRSVAPRLVAALSAGGGAGTPFEEAEPF